MSYDTWKTTDTPGDLDEGRYRSDRLSDDVAREARWRDAMTWLALEYRGDFRSALSDLADAYCGLGIDETSSDTDPRRAWAAFAAEDGWSACLHVLARSMRNRADEVRR